MMHYGVEVQGQRREHEVTEKKYGQQREGG